MTQTPADSYDRWVGKSQTLHEEVSLTLVQRMAAMLDLDPSALRKGDPLPRHWLSLCFTPNALQSHIGHDGHPRKGDFLPPIPLPRRMFAGRRIAFDGDLFIGEEAEKTTQIVRVQEKAGRSGPLVFLTLRNTYRSRGREVISETQEVVYREAVAAAAGATAGQGETVPAGADWSTSVRMDPVLVFRYSALTWNGHRIHYDRDYAMGQEGYPERVMNGALTILLMLQEAQRQAGGRALKQLEARLVGPLFVGEEMSISGKASGAGVQLWAGDRNGGLAASCTAIFEDAT